MIREIDFSYLPGNLIEIQAALDKATDQEAKQLSLTAIPQTDGYQVFYTNTVIGKIVQIANSFKNRSYQEKELRAGITYTLTTLFEQKLREVHQVYQCYMTDYIRKIHQYEGQALPLEAVQANYQDYLKQALGQPSSSSQDIYWPYLSYASSYLANAHSLSEKEKARVRRSVMRFSETTEIFWRSFCDSQFSYQGFQSMLKGKSLALCNPILYHTLHRARCLIQLEGIAEQPIPMLLLAKLGQGTANETDGYYLEEWFKKITAKKKQMTLKEFEEAIVEICNVINIGLNTPIYPLDLLAKLSQFDSAFFLQDDEDLLQWRHGLKPDDKISCNEKQLTVEQRLGPFKDIDNHFEVFELADKAYQQHVVKIGRNAIELKLECLKREREAKWFEEVQRHIWPDQKPQIWDLNVSEVDLDGKCILLEKLDISLDQYGWKSQSLELEKDELNIAYEIAKRLYAMVYFLKKSPRDLLPKHWMLDKKGVIKFVNVLDLRKFNYNQFEQFCRAISHGNKFVYIYLMVQSCLIKHPMARFYTKAVEKALMSGKVWDGLLSDERFPLDDGHSAYRGHVIQLTQQAVDLRERCFKRVKTRLQSEKKHDYHFDDELKELVYRELFAVYEESMSPGVLLPTLEDELIRRFEKKELLSVKHTIQDKMVDAVATIATHFIIG